MQLSDFMKVEGLTDPDLAALVERDRSSVFRWRTGKSKPDFDALVRLEQISRGRVTARDFVPESVACQ